MVAQTSERTLTLGSEAALLAAGLHVPDPAPLLDSLIAASALALGLRVVTRNTSDFLHFGVTVIDSWEVKSTPRFGFYAAQYSSSGARTGWSLYGDS